MKSQLIRSGSVPSPSCGAVDSELGIRMERVRVTSFYYKVRGACQSSIIEASDGCLYVLKVAGSHMQNLLFNEAFGTELLRHFGLPVATWKPLELENEFIEAHPEMWFKSGHDGRRPVAGLHFGSRLVSSKRSAGAYQIIPSSWVSRVKNRSKFIGALAVDIWSNHCDRRQAIYTRSGENLKATFIDNGHMFGGLEGTEIASPRCCMTHDLAVYKGLDVHRSLRRWHKSILEADLRDIRRLAEEIPSEWCPPGQLDRTLESLQSRRRKMGSLLREAEGILGHDQSWNSNDFVNSLAPHVSFAPESE